MVSSKVLHYIWEYSTYQWLLLVTCDTAGTTSNKEYHHSKCHTTHHLSVSVQWVCLHQYCLDEQPTTAVPQQQLQPVFSITTLHEKPQNMHIIKPSPNALW
ncbi:uncharacterized protein LOC123548455 [Mercenaria mercenaria]|uniref:uncharacterized protein LOC123548455 n=1 Tax=Mercenaria mercenaria TaxID=6596 RepID=UPI00234EC0B5|nr:uncharacterized protein LOC123548455 [Mercenaria mercenaria]